MSLSDVATLVVALGTVVLALVTSRQVKLSRSALDLSIRPFLGDPAPSSGSEEMEDLLFGAPGRISVQVPRGAFFYRGEGSGVFNLSVAFQNLGTGLAAVAGAEVDTGIAADVYVSRRFVPAGSIVRVNVSVGTSFPGNERFDDQWWAMEGLAVTIRYSDANGRQRLISRATIEQAATRLPYVAQIDVFREGEARPLVTGRGSY